MSLCANFYIFSIIIAIVTTSELSVEQNTTDEIINVQQESKLNEEKKSIKSTDVIQLNLGDQLIMTTRSTLTRVTDSTLAIMFNGRWDDKLSRDHQGNIYLDFNPILFDHLLEQLRLLENNVSFVIYPPLSPSLVIPFGKMLRKLSINQLHKPKDVIELYIGGEVLTTRQKIFTQISNLTTHHLFVDSDPKLFRQLVNQLREEQEIDIQEENESFNTTLTSLNSDCKSKRKIIFYKLYFYF
jgi:hypothetical protein